MKKDIICEILRERVKNGEASISVKKSKDGNAEACVKGDRLTILITLAGFEKSILEETDTPKEVWEMIKEAIGETSDYD